MCELRRNPLQMKTNHFNNRIIAHRGAWKEFGLPENSKAALLQAIAIGCGGVECDLHVTADHKVVLCHDALFQGQIIEKTTYQELLKYRLSDGSMLPKIDDFFSTIQQQTSCQWVFEIKSASSVLQTLHHVACVAATLAPVFSAHQGVFILFDLQVALHLKKLQPTWKVIYLNGDKSPQELSELGLDGLNYHYSIWQNHSNYLAEAKALDLFRGSWTLNEWSTVEPFLHDNHFYITTDYPVALMHLMNK